MRSRERNNRRRRRIGVRLGVGGRLVGALERHVRGLGDGLHAPSAGPGNDAEVFQTTVLVRTVHLELHAGVLHVVLGEVVAVRVGRDTAPAGRAEGGATHVGGIVAERHAREGLHGGEAAKQASEDTSGQCELEARQRHLVGHVRDERVHLVVAGLVEVLHVEPVGFRPLCFRNGTEAVPGRKGGAADDAVAATDRIGLHLRPLGDAGAGRRLDGGGDDEHEGSTPHAKRLRIH